jgi:hypothetical protein
MIPLAGFCPFSFRFYFIFFVQNDNKTKEKKKSASLINIYKSFYDHQIN